MHLVYLVLLMVAAKMDTHLNEESCDETARKWWGSID